MASTGCGALRTAAGCPKGEGFGSAKSRINFPASELRSVPNEPLSITPQTTPKTIETSDCRSSLLYNHAPYASVAQLDRVGGFEPLGREFESLRVHQIKKGPKRGPFFIWLPRSIELLSSTKRKAFWTAVGCPQGEDFGLAKI